MHTYSDTTGDNGTTLIPAPAGTWMVHTRGEYGGKPICWLEPVLGFDTTPDAEGVIVTPVVVTRRGTIEQVSLERGLSHILPGNALDWRVCPGAELHPGKRRGSLLRHPQDIGC